MSYSKTELKPSTTVHILIPAFNESENIYAVVRELRELKTDDNLAIKHIVVCDNASTDNTAELAAKAGATVVHEAQQGYGIACLRAMQALRELMPLPQDIVVFIDGDHSVVASEVKLLTDQVKQQSGLVVGARVATQMQTRAMSPHQRAGNFIACRMIRFIWGVNISDLGPFRALRYQNLTSLIMQDESFGWTTEMQVKAIQRGMPYSEVAVSTLRRRGQSKISNTVRGTIGAAYGIFSTIFWLWWQARDVGFSNELYR